MGLVLDWQTKLGYSRDPFEKDISPASRHLVGMAPLQERLNLFLIKEERFGTISGDTGTGKSLVLQWMEEELAPQKSHAQHLLDAKEDTHDAIITSLLTARLSFLEKRFGKLLKLPIQDQKKELLQRMAKEQRNVLLVDNAGSLGKAEIELLSDIVIKTPTHLILADTEEKIKKLHLPETLIDRLKLKIPAFDHDQLLELLQNRIESAGSTGTFPFTEKDITDLIKRSDKNPAKLLQHARERAIELSLKVRAIPAAPLAVKQASTGFLGIKVQKVGAKDESPTILIQERRTEPPQEQIPDDEIPDADLLEKVVTQKPTAPRIKQKKDVIPHENVDDIVVMAKKHKEVKEEKPSKAKQVKEFEKLAAEFAHQHKKRKR